MNTIRRRCAVSAILATSTLMRLAGISLLLPLSAPPLPPSLLPVVCHRRRHRLGSAAIMFITRLVAGVVGARAGVTTASPTRR